MHVGEVDLFDCLDNSNTPVIILQKIFIIINIHFTFLSIFFHEYATFSTKENEIIKYAFILSNV